MADGFKIADAYVDVKAKLDVDSLDRAARAAGKRAGDTLSSEIKAGGGKGGEGFAKTFTESADTRIRDSKGRFVKTFEGMSTDTGKRSGGLFGKLFSGSMLGNMAAVPMKLGGLIASGIGVAGPAAPKVGLMILAGVAATAPLAGATLGAALTAGVAGAGIGIGVAASLKQPAVRAAAVDLKATISEQVNRIGQDWAPTMVSAIGSARSQMASLGPTLQRALAPAKGYVQPLVDGFMGLVRNAMPGFSSLLAKAKPVIDAISTGLAGVGDALSQMFGAMSGETDEMASGMQFVFQRIQEIIVAGGYVISWLAKAWGVTVDWAAALSGFLAGLPGIGDHFKNWNDKMQAVKATAEGTGPALAGAAGGMRDYNFSAGTAADTSESMAMRQRILNSTMKAGADAAGDLKGAMDALNGAAQSAEEAQIAYKEAVKAATDSVKENGRTTDLNTEKGRANRSALLALAQAGQQRAQAQYDQTAATKGTSAAEAAAQRAYSASREQLIATARRMGMTRSEAVAYANKIMAIPKAWNTKIKADTSSARASISSLRSYLKNIPDETVNIAMRITGNTNVSASAAAIRKQYGMSKGGAVTGPGPRGVDSVFRILAPGEHVWTDKEVSAIGGHRAMEAMRAAVRARAGGGGSGGGAGLAPPGSRLGSGGIPKLEVPRAPNPRFKEGRSGVPTPVTKPTPGGSAPSPGGGGGSGGGYGGGDEITNIYIENVTLDPSGIRTIAQLADLLSSIGTIARTSRARTATAAGV